MSRAIVLMGAALGSLVILAGSMSVLAERGGGEHVIVDPDGLFWTAGPPLLPAGAEVAIVSGDPGQEQPYVLRLRFPGGYEIPAHTHPNDENVTVVSGTFHLGMGNVLGEAQGQPIAAAVSPACPRVCPILPGRAKKPWSSCTAWARSASPMSIRPTTRGASHA